MKKILKSVSFNNNEIDQIAKTIDQMKPTSKELSNLIPIFLESMKTSVIDDIFLKKSINSQYQSKNLIILKIKKFFFYLFKSLRTFRLLSQNNVINQCDIVFYPVQPTHVLVASPVIHYLINKGIKVEVVVDREKIYHLLKQENIQSIFIKKKNLSLFIDSSLKGEISNALLLLSKANYRDQNYKNRAKDIIEILHNKINSFATILATYRFIESSLNPKVIIVGNDITEVGRAISMLASKNIVTHSIMHGNVSGWNAHKFHSANIIHVFGESSYNSLIDYGINKKNICISGAPHITIPKPNIKISQLLRKKGFSKYILVALSGPGFTVTESNHIKIIDEIRIAANQIKGCLFIIKLHRKDDDKYYNNMPLNVAIFDNTSRYLPQSINEIILQSEAVLTGGSSVGIEAIALNKQVITIDMMEELTEVSFIKHGFTKHVTENGKLSNVISNVFLNDNNGNSKKNLDTSTIFKRTGSEASEFIAKRIIKDVNL